MILKKRFIQGIFFREINICERELIVQKKSLLIYAHYYTPDVASTGQIIRELAEGMLDVFDITLICVVPSYDGHVSNEYKNKRYYIENINGVKVYRIRVPEFDKTKKTSRIKNVLSYFLGAIFITFKTSKQDYIYAISQPPILGGLLGVWGKFVKKAKFIYNIQDFNPEQVMAVSYTKNKFIIKLMMILDKFSCKKSDLIITVGQDLVETVRNRFEGKKVPNTVMINNWIDEKVIFPLSDNDDGVKNFKKRYSIENKFIIMYSGNIGLYYDLEGIIKVINRLGDNIKCIDGREVVFAFVGAGSKLNDLKEYVNEYNMSNVAFMPYQKKEELIYSLNAADVHLCLNSKGIKGVSCPSKFYGLAAVAKPVIGVLERGSEVQGLIERIECGLCAEPGEYEKIEKNIRWFIENSNSQELKDMGLRAREYLESNLSKDLSIEKYKKSILSL